MDRVHVAQSSVPASELFTDFMMMLAPLADTVYQPSQPDPDLPLRSDLPG